MMIEQIELPELSAGQVLVDISFSGVCGSQLLEVRGLRGEDRYLPHTLGHEASGIVRDIGPGVTRVAPGNRVVATWIAAGGLSAPSTTYLSGGESVNSGAISTFMRAAVISEDRLVPLHADISMPDAALLGCAVPTGAGAVINTAETRPGESVAIFGVGGVGSAALVGARIVNASPIIAVDVVPEKLEHARKLGATHTIDAGSGDATAQIMALTNGRGVDVAVEAAGRPETIETAFASVREGGGRCVIAGNVPLGQNFEIDPYDLIKGRRIIGTWGGSTVPDRDIPIYAHMVETGVIDLSVLGTHTFALSDVNRALDDLEAGKVGRALLDMSL
jgi:S-(hydroxymethyl)glutathione dehydrogenase/alcohol dehydrogenase